MNEEISYCNCAAHGRPKGPWRGMRYPANTERQRFEEKFRVTPGCWEWIAGLTLSGYGAFKAAQMQMRAHRYAYTLYVGEIPKGLLVRHKCDNPKCVNPDHLELGTAKDNTDDMILRGRRNDPVGERAGSAVLTAEQVISIFNDPRTQVAIAKDYGVGQRAIGKIKRRERWKHILGAKNGK